MKTLSSLKKDLEFNIGLVALLDVMKGIASSEFQMLQKRKERFKRFLDSFSGFFEMIDFSQVQHPFGAPKVETAGIVMITSDEGFMGGLNTHVIDEALSRRRGEAELIIIGERGAAHLAGAGEKFKAFPGITEKNKFDLAVEVKDYIMQESIQGRIGKVILSFPYPVSFTLQRVDVVKLLPCTELFEKREKVIAETEKVIVESSIASIIEHLASEWIRQKLYEVFEDSKLSEFAARTIRLEQSYQELSQYEKTLKYQFFRAKHSFIDKGMREMFTSQLIKKKEKR